VRTQVGIVGAGPAGLVLARLLQLRGIESVVLESRSRDYCQERVRAGLLEQGTVDLLTQIGAGERMRSQGLAHRGVNLRFKGGTHRIDFDELAGGRGIMIYPQGDVIRDLVDARLAAGGPILFEAGAVSLHGLDSARPVIRFQQHGESREVECDYVAGCDGFHGVCRAAIPGGVLTTYERNYPFGWLGILAQAPPASDELIYAYHERGFALLTMRTPQLSRLYIQCAPDDDAERWPDETIWSELQTRLAAGRGWKLTEGPILQKSVSKMHSFVVEPMQYERLYLAGDAAHIVPPTGAKGLNLAVADVWVLARALQQVYSSGRGDLLAEYSRTCLRRVWQVQRFSWWMTAMMHRFDDDNLFDRRRQLAELEYVASSRAAATTLAENYVGLPME